MNHKPEVPIVVAAYNRPQSLLRILGSLNNASYSKRVRLIISIDKSDSNQVVELAQQFNWKHGEKEIIVHTENLGLRNHVLACGDLTQQYDAIIMLEDDLFVSPGFYEYTLQAIDFYKSDKKISGISLYAHTYNETAHLPFIPLADDSDVFFMQLPSSWGQCWTKEQWAGFRKWYKLNNKIELTPEIGIPANVANWPKSSWKKYFIWYMIEAEKYFVYPRYSLSTNCGDPGVHFHKKLLFQQVPLLSGIRDFRFKQLSYSYAVYDACCEILPETLNLFSPNLTNYKYTVDLYGMKTRHEIKTKYLLTSKKCSSHLLSFARELKPIESNIIFELGGNDIFLTTFDQCIMAKHQAVLSPGDLNYFFSVRDYQLPKFVTVEKEYTIKELINILIKRFISWFAKQTK